MPGGFASKSSFKNKQTDIVIHTDSHCLFQKGIFGCRLKKSMSQNNQRRGPLEIKGVNLKASCINCTTLESSYRLH